jgi:Domain of unknown function (DUF3331)
MSPAFTIFIQRKAMNTPEAADAWEYALDLLLLIRLSKPSRAFGGEARGHCTPGEFAAFGDRLARLARERAVNLHIVEKYSKSTIAVCWRDATSGCYAEQLWRAVIARTGSTCALSGLQIRPGDAVFRPWGRGYKPANSDSMILATAVEVIGAE